MPIETLIEECLLSFVSYWDSALSEMWFFVSNLDNAPDFLKSTVQSSTGPTLAFLLSFLAFRWQEQFKQNKETLAVRTMLRIEVDYNLNRIESLTKEFELIAKILPPDLVKVPFSVSPHGLRTQAFDSQVAALAKALEPEQLSDVCQIYADFRVLAYAYEYLQPMYIDSWDEEKRGQCERTLQHLIQAKYLLSNPLNQESQP
ncbi:hypothetical protein VB780_09725 [Leptolyngbya sp. CCNP1308]|uniref:hypothetical protein n=1 Tax=Leptolyngbya sp. CCNP1308 TaxID=3110255 RepID=UPI002B2152A8|nr:hypothetical protein [Leptolyngbya sp. CCNP1308]MEA5448846.1 hypothetical protein [Leptolyngbya sp. CCNP1308]